MLARKRILDFLVAPGIASSSAVAMDRACLQLVAEPGFDRAGVLRVSSMVGDEVSLGRYHLRPADTASSVFLHRRLTGGRALACGEGFVTVSLVLPDRGALSGQPAASLQPSQVLNRSVRGLLEGCKHMTLPVIYPGLDAMTLRRLPFAYLSMEETPSGAVLFEAVIANTRSFSVLPKWLDALDPDGVVKVDMIDASSVTSLAHELQAELPFEDVASMVQLGYAKHFGITCEPAAPPVPSAHAVELADRRDAGRQAGFAKYASERVQLGVLEVYLALTPQGAIADILCAGDFIANSAAIDALESRLRGCPVAASAIDRIVSDVFADPNFILGIGAPSILTRVILRAAQ